MVGDHNENESVEMKKSKSKTKCSNVSSKKAALLTEKANVVAEKIGNP